MLENTKKTVIALGAVALIAWLIYWAFSAVYRSAEKLHPHPTDPAETVLLFFQALQDQDYQQSYKLLVGARKSFTVLGKQTRQAYENHFDRISAYLHKYAGPDFAQTMEASTDGREAYFANDIVLTVTLGTSSSGFDKKNHYGIRQINEFPIDVAPGIGVEAHTRRTNRALDSIMDLSPTEPSDDVSEIIRDQPGESKRARQQRLIQAFKHTRQLDTRHSVLIWIIRESRREPQTRKFLASLTQDENEPPHLRNLAQQALADNL